MNGIFNERQVLMSFLLLRIKLWYLENEAQEIAYFAMPMIIAISTLKTHTHTHKKLKIFAMPVILATGKVNKRASSHRILQDVTQSYKC